MPSYCRLYVGVSVDSVQLQDFLYIKTVWLSLYRLFASGLSLDLSLLSKPGYKNFTPIPVILANHFFGGFHLHTNGHVPSHVDVD